MAHKNRRRKARAEKFSRRSLPGAAPGILVADPRAPKPTIHVIAYAPDKVSEKEVEDIQSIRACLDEYPVTWINVVGLGDASVIGKVGEFFDLHRLALEDVINVHQRAKVEQYKDYCFIVVRAVKAGETFSSEQLSIFLGRKYVLTFQERSGGPFEAVRERLRKGTGRIRTAGPDHLAYALIDATIDWYFPALEQFGETLESARGCRGRPSRSALHRADS